MPLTNLNDAKHWHDRAAEMRALAECMKDSDAMVLNLAKVYDKLGDQAEARAKSGVDFFSVPSPLRAALPPAASGFDFSSKQGGGRDT